MTAHHGSGSGVAAVDRALAILTAIEEADAPISLSALARHTLLHKSTILRLVGSLIHCGLVVRLQDASYVLGPATMRLGLSFERNNPMRHLIEPLLLRLVDQGTESASFYIRHDHRSRLCLLRVDSHHSTLDRIHAGQVLPLDKGAAGRVILTSGTSTAVPGSQENQNGDGVIVSLGERDPSCAGMAAPVFSVDQRLIGALSLSGPRERFRDADIARMRPMLLSAARELTQSFGGKFAAEHPAPSGAD